MKIIHCADIHLGSRIDSKFPREVSEQKREELRSTFRRMVEYAKEEGISLILLAGDVFDSDRPFKRDKDFFYSVVENNPEIDFLYLRGNHDKESTGQAPANLKTFGDAWSCYDYGDVVIWGIEMAPGNATSLYSSLSPDQSRRNIVMMHGQIADTQGMDKVHLPSLRDKSINYLALGHVHTYTAGRVDRRGAYAYSGCLEGRGFDESGEKGFVVLEVTERSIKHTFLPFCEHVIRRIELDITGLGDAYAVYQAAVAHIADREDIYRFELIGEVEAHTDELCGDVAKYLASHCRFADVKDRTRRRIDLAAFEQDPSLAGEFVRRVFDSEAFTHEEKLQIASLGLRALKGIEVE